MTILRPRADAAEVWALLAQQRFGAWSHVGESIDAADAGEISVQDLKSALDLLAQQAVSSERPDTWYQRRDLWGIWLSLVLHLLVVMSLAWLFLPRIPGEGALVLQGWESGPTLVEADFASVSLAEAETQSELSLWNSPLPEAQPTLATRTEPTPWLISESATSLIVPVTASQVAAGGGGLSGRRAARRAELVARGGGNEASEDAVDLGLEWLVKHQWPDGGWSFRHPAHSQARNAGSSASRTAATGLALLCFLGRDHHHAAESQYQKVVLDGLNYLLKISQQGDLTQLTEHSMYGQGIATLALAEAYALSRDSTLREPTQSAVTFIVEAQHPLGGWRYMPGQLGDLNVTGWQWLALKTARLAGLEVPDRTLQQATKFVDSQSVSPGAYFTYPGLDPNLPQPVPTAIGILLRMQQGWGHGREEIQMGVDYLATQRVSADHIYFNYYTTMVLFHFGGPLWRAWNEEMRDFLLNTQSDVGHERGSWFFPHLKTGGEGGRLYCTAMAVLILEVYYRHLRLYDEAVLIRDFPLD
jgi:hypothetical protein